MGSNIEITKEGLIEEIKRRQSENIIEKTNAELIIKLINSAENINEAISIAQLGTTYKKTGFHYDKRLEKLSNEIKYLKKNDELSFEGTKRELKHKLIIGDNYDALLNLTIKYRKKIDIIYIDPPYGKDSMGEFAKTNYDNSITRDNLLSMMYPRLELAKQLLSENGVIYCSIDNKNQAYMKCLFDDVFGEHNFLGIIVQNKGNAQNDAINFQNNHEYILTYSKKRKYNGNKEEPLIREGKYIKKELYQDENGKYYYKGSGIITGGQGGTLNARKNLGYTIYYNETTKDKIAIQDYDLELARTSNNEDEIYTTKQEYIENGYVAIRPPRKGNKLGCWTWKLEKFNSEKDKILVTENYSIVQKNFVKEEEITEIEGKKYYIENSLSKNTKSIWDYSSGAGTTQLKEIMTEKDFDNPKNVELIKHLIEIYREKENPVVLDFFAGSGTTGQAVLELNEKDGGNRIFILCTLDEITETTPNGVPYDVTAKRLKRIMTGECYDGNKEFNWIENHEPFGDGLDVCEIQKVSNFERTKGKTPFEVIDETLYDIPKFQRIQDKIEWVCQNFEVTENSVESDEEWKNRMEEN